MSRRVGTAKFLPSGSNHVCDPNNCEAWSREWNKEQQRPHECQRNEGTVGYPL